MGYAKVKIKGSFDVELYYNPHDIDDPEEEYGQDSENTFAEHERHHASISISNWNSLVNEVNPLELGWCRQVCADLATAYANAALEFWSSKSDLENERFDEDTYHGGHRVAQYENRFNAARTAYYIAKQAWVVSSCEAEGVEDEDTNE